jgi:hypothetical protein
LDAYMLSHGVFSQIFDIGYRYLFIKPDAHCVTF